IVAIRVLGASLSSSPKTLSRRIIAEMGKPSCFKSAWILYNLIRASSINLFRSFDLRSLPREHSFACFQREGLILLLMFVSARTLFTVILMHTEASPFFNSFVFFKKNKTLNEFLSIIFLLVLSDTKLWKSGESFATQQADSQCQLRSKGGDKYLLNLLHLLLHQSRSKCAVFCLVGKNKNSRYSLNIRSLLLLLSLKVVPPGIEPGTQGFSVLCSTN